ncbi:competence type IV pilus ATPase ComGA [Alkalibacterium sp. 20]|uniref:competence type IV pilus ATPase ComGA n=1 Tax=Alkalibacterium sp. 20 TaxID=1798803 RepID=UPI0008FFEB00|nr:competence type IV pilus ATPase ComGA [Alkalibacterium sp. 20]OJF94299.1 general secretion pathway protein GspE [Alkalibacterium sp. 20]
MDTESFATHLLTMADSYRTSDIHILPEQKHYDVYFRLNGQMEKQYYLDRDEGTRLISYFKFLSNMDVGERRRPQSGSTTFALSEKAIDCRFSTISNYQSQESLVIRLLKQKDEESFIPGTFFAHEWEKLEKLVQAKSGLLLFSGPVDSGKTTTMYHLIKNRMQGEKQQVITVEDPVEIEESSFLQTQVNETAGVTYEHLLKSSLRHHPDVIIVGEIRDEETAKMVMRGALTGHLIVASIHAKNAEGVLSRMMELGVGLPLLKQTLIGVAFQTLIPLYCPLCDANCQTYCTHYNRGEKRVALFEVMTAKELSSMVEKETHAHLSVEPITREFNHLLKKVFVNGYITEKTYQRYFIPNA